MSYRAASVAAPGGISFWSRGDSRARSASATQPTFRQWSRTVMPGFPSSVVFAQHRSWRGPSPSARGSLSLIVGAGTHQILPKDKVPAQLYADLLHIKMVGSAMPGSRGCRDACRFVERATSLALVRRPSSSPREPFLQGRFRSAARQRASGLQLPPRSASGWRSDSSERFLFSYMPPHAIWAPYSLRPLHQDSDERQNFLLTLFPHVGERAGKMMLRMPPRLVSY
jgi:hypothetical protein